MQAISGHDLVTLQLAAELAGATENAIKQAFRHMERRGWIEKRERGVYAPTEKGRAAALAAEELPKGRYARHDKRRPRRKTVRDLAWKALRGLGKASAMELASLLPEDMRGKCDPAFNIRAFLKALECCGYVLKLKRGPNAYERADRFVLIRNTGPLTPLWRPSKGMLFDPNLGLHVPPKARRAP